MPYWILLFLIVTSCQVPTDMTLHHFQWHGRFAHIQATLPGDSLKLAHQYQWIQQTVEKVETEFSPMSPLSTQIYSSPIHSWIDLDSAAFQILAFALEFRKITNRRIDPGVGDLIHAWKISWNQSTGDSPPDTLIQRLVRELQTPFLHLDTTQRRLEILQAGKHIAWGAYLEGYLLETIAHRLDQNLVPQYLVEVGGDFVYKGFKPNGEKWTIGVKNPFQQTQLAFTMTLPPQNRSLCTSGDYEQRFVDQTGKIRHHIIDPYTGYPSQYAHSVTVTSNYQGMIAHSLCTWFMTMPLDSVKRKVEESKGSIDALLVLRDSTYWASAGMRDNLTLIETQFKPYQIMTNEQ